MKFSLTTGALISILLLSCSLYSSASTPTQTPSFNEDHGLTQPEIATLSSLELVDDHPLYTMRYIGAYPGRVQSSEPANLPRVTGHAQTSCQVTWGCSLFAALGDDGKRLFGRNFDWRFSPALLLFTDPPDGYASVSMVDIEYLGFEGERSKNITDLPLKDRETLLDAPSLPFDGMNEKGLVVAMAAVPREEMPIDPARQTIDHLEVIREILDHAATVDEAVAILGSYNIDMGNVPLHYLIASAAGDSALVEFYQGELVVFRSEHPWQVATNFLLAVTDGNGQGQCRRYDLINQRLQETGGSLTVMGAFSLLADVSQETPQGQSNTQWSMVYDLTDRNVNIIMAGNFRGKAHLFQLEGTLKSPAKGENQ